MPEGLLNVEKLKREARTRKKNNGTTHTLELDVVARQYGYKSWSLLMRDQNKLRTEKEDADDFQPIRDDAHLSPYDNPSYVRAIFKP